MAGGLRNRDVSGLPTLANAVASSIAAKDPSWASPQNFSSSFNAIAQAASQYCGIESQLGACR